MKFHTTVNAKPVIIAALAVALGVIGLSWLIGDLEYDDVTYAMGFFLGQLILLQALYRARDRPATVTEDDKVLRYGDRRAAEALEREADWVERRGEQKGSDAASREVTAMSLRMAAQRQRDGIGR